MHDGRLAIPADASDIEVAGVVLRNQIHGLTRLGRYARDVHARASLWDEAIRTMVAELDRFDATYAQARGSLPPAPAGPMERALDDERRAIEAALAAGNQAMRR